MGSLTPVEQQSIKVGSPISQSIYLKSGDLLFKEGRVVTSQRQKSVLVSQGFVFNHPKDTAPKLPADDVPQYAIKYPPRTATDTIFDTKERWLGELYHILKLSKEPLVLNFSYQIFKLANEIQWVCEYHQHALLAAFQIDTFNDYGLLHALHSGVISEVIGKQTGMTRSERLSVIAGAITHDIGMAEQQTDLHEQTSPLTEQQKADLAQHPLLGYKRLVELGVDDKDWLDITLHHHERIDGKGYPHKLVDEHIPLAVKIMSVADTYTALVRPTSNRLNNSGKKALGILYKERGVSLSSELIDILINTIGIYPIGALVRLNNGEIGVVIKAGKKISRPLVSVLLSADLKPVKGRRLRDTQTGQFEVIDELALTEYFSLFEGIQAQWTAVI